MLAWLLPTVWSPTVAAMLLAWSSEGAAGVKRELQHLRYERGAGRWVVAAAVLPAFAVIVAVFIARAAGDVAPVAPSAALPMMIAFQLATGAVGEELGWRGFLIPRLRQRLGHVAAWWSMAILWSLWHVAGMFFPGTPLQVAPAGLFLLNAALFGVFLGFLFDRSGDSVLATMLAHLSLNMALGVGGVRISSLVFWWAIVALCGVLAIVVTAIQVRPAGEAHQFERPNVSNDPHDLNDFGVGFPA